MHVILRAGSIFVTQWYSTDMAEPMDKEPRYIKYGLALVLVTAILFYGGAYFIWHELASGK